MPHQVTKTVCPGDDGYTNASDDQDHDGGPYSVNNDGADYVYEDDDAPIIDVRSSGTSSTSGVTADEDQATTKKTTAFVWSG